MRKFWIAPLLSTLLVGAAAADPTPSTIGDYSNVLNDIAARLDLQLADRQKAGDAAAAQRLALAAAMMRRVSGEFHSAEQEALVDDPATLPSDVKTKLDAAYARAQDSETRAAAEPRYIDEAHAAFNALLDVLPMKRRHPTFYGLLSNDLTEPTARLNADIVVYGDRLIDPVYKAAPTVAYQGTDLPPDAVRASADRLEITLPADTKAAVRFAPPPCEERPSFGLRVHALYSLAHWFLPFVWHTEIATTADLFALASPALYEARISAQAEAEGVTASTVNFRQRSPFVIAHCEETNAANVALTLPAGATDVACHAEWVEALGKTSTSGRCEQQDGALSASGALTGPAKVCSPDKLCTCSSNGQGYLEMSGSYGLSQSAKSSKALADVPPLDFPRGGLAATTFGEERVKFLKIDVARRDCPVVVETLTIGLGDEANAAGAAVSKSGDFRAVFKDRRLSVGSASAF